MKDKSTLFYEQLKTAKSGDALEFGWDHVLKHPCLWTIDKITPKFVYFLHEKRFAKTALCEKFVKGELKFAKI